MSDTTGSTELDNAAGGEGEKFLGKYRGVVLDNVDPLQIGRILAMVPDVSSLLPTSWAMPCVPGAGLQAGMLVVPSIGAGVWIEFEQGDPEKPILAGCRLAPGDPSPLAYLGLPVSPSIVFSTSLQNTISISDTPGPLGGIMLKSTTGATLIVNDTGIYIQNGKGAVITMIGPITDINAGAITIT